MTQTPRKTQVIGDRKVSNPRTRAHPNINAVLSMETCGCGYSYARPGVGYKAPGGWTCKRCGQLHTADRGARVPEGAQLKPDPEKIREFDARRNRPPDYALSTPEDIIAHYAAR